MTETGHDRAGETPERPTRQPARAPKSPAPDQPYQRFRELTGADRNWVRVLAETLREAPGDLDGLLAPGSEAYRALAEHDDRGGETDRDDPLAPALSFGLRTARVLLELARALADPDAGTGRAERAVEQAARHWRDRGMLVACPETPAAGPGPLPRADGSAAEDLLPPGLPAVRAAVERLADRPAAAFTALLVRELTGRPAASAPSRPRWRHRRGEAAITVLLVRQGRGFPAELRLRRVPDGPPGLHPDPAVMAFLASPDDRLSACLTAAQAASGAAARGDCALWAVTEAKPVGTGRSPCNDISGGSLGAAFGVALLDLYGRGPFRPPRWSVLLREDAALSGVLGAEREIDRVDQLGPKLAAARSGTLVVLPIGNRTEAQRAAQAAGTGVRTAFASTLDQAYRHTHRFNRARVLLATLLAVVVVAAPFSWRQWQENRNVDREQARADSRTLAAGSNKKAKVDPMGATVLAAAALDASDTPEARSAARAVLAAQSGAVLPGAGAWAGFTPDGRGLLAVDTERRVFGFDVRSRKRTGRVLDAAQPDPERWRQPGPLALSPDRATLATSDEEGQVWLWALPDGKPRGPLKASGDDDFDGEELAQVAFSPDGRTLATIRGTNGLRAMDAAHATVTLWDVRTGKPLRRLRTDHTSPLRALAFSPDGTTLATAAGTGDWPGAKDDFTVRRWNLADGKATGRTMTGASSTATVLAFSPDGAHLACGAENGTSRTWLTGNGQEYGSPFGAHDGGVRALAWRPDSTLLATSGATDVEVRVWNPDGADTGLLLDGHTGNVTTLDWSPDGNRLASGAPAEGGAGAVRLWNLDPVSRPGLPFTTAVGDRPGAVTWGPEDGALAAGGWDGVSLRADDENGAVSWRPPPLPRLPAAITGVAYSAAGTDLATAGADGSVRQWSLSPSRERWSWRGAAPLRALTHASAAPVLAAGSDRGEVLVWDDADRDGAGEPRVLPGHRGRVTAVALTPDGGALLSAGRDGTVRLRERASGRQLWFTRLTDPRRPGSTAAVAATALALDTSGRRLAVGGADGAVRVWTLGSGGTAPGSGAPALLYGPQRAITALAWQGTDGELAVADLGGMLAAWDAGARRLTQILSTGSTVAGWRAYTALAYAPDGRRLLTMDERLAVALLPADKISAGGGDQVRSMGKALTTVFLSPETARGTVVSVTEPTSTLYLPEAPEATVRPMAVHVWDGRRGRLLRSFLLLHGALPDTAYPPSVSGGLAFHVRDGSAMGTGTLTLVDATGRLARFDLVTGKQTGPAHRLHAPGTSDTTLGEVESAVFSPDGTRVAVVDGRYEGVRLTVHDTATGQPGPVQATPPKRPELAFSPDGRLLAAAGHLTAADMKRSEANGTKVAAGPGRLGLWRVADGKRLADPPLLPEDAKAPDVDGLAVTELAFGPDGRRLMVSGSAGTQLWDTADPARPRAVRGPRAVAPAAALSPDGTVLAMVGVDTVSLYAREGGERLAPPFPYEIEDIWRETHISGDGRRLIAGSSEAVPRRWDVSLWRAPLMDRLCERIGRAVTRAEWEAVAPPDIPYRELCD
ncbi:WD40 repeat domain-containing protein [Streptomyces sp. NPDC046887]|uniref:WD40 repeat domain-containing protein n=1 Tax=Streptomyces sp. NPDC046887 TaxID=3155472 RepID=UPI0033C9741E